MKISKIDHDMISKLSDCLIDYVDPPHRQREADIGLLLGNPFGHDQLVHTCALLYRSGMFKRIVVSGGVRVDGKQECHLIAENLLEFGIGSDAVVLERWSTNTKENIVNTRALVGETTSSVLAVGKCYAARRVLMTLERNWPELSHFSFQGVNEFGVTRNRWFRSPVFQDRVLSEIRKIPKYIDKGDIAEIDASKIGLDRAKENYQPRPAKQHAN